MRGGGGPRVFLSHTPADADEVGFIERALVDRGIEVVRTRDGDPGADVRDALDSSVLLLAFHSVRYPVRFACQWELTRAFLSAAHHGEDPGDRILVVNPESGDDHIRVPGLTGGALFDWRRDRVAALVDAVTARLGGLPMGGPPSVGARVEWDERLLRPQRFVGRYEQVWAVRGALHGEPPARTRSAVWLSGAAGMGKTVLAERYARLFRDAYPGGQAWTSLAGDSVGARWAAEVTRAARAWFDLDVTGLEPRQARATLSDRLTAAGRPVLWVVDDVPAGLDPAVLDDLVLGSPFVHTVLIGRTRPVDWPVPDLPVGGLTPVEVEELLGGTTAASAALVERCQGHPLLLAVAARGTGEVEGGVGGDDGGDDVGAGLLSLVRERGDHARVVLGFASLLAPVPFVGELVADGLAEVLGVQAPVLVARALDELDEHRLLHRVARCGPGRSWRLPALVAEAVRRDLDAPLLAALTGRAAWLVERALVAEGDDPDLCAHAMALVANPATPRRRRLALCRAVAEAHAARGDLPAALAASEAAVATAGADPDHRDVLRAAGLAVATGAVDVALRHTAAVVRRAREVADQELEYRARFLAAAAHDLRGAYPLADHVFHHHPLVRAHGGRPVWADERERDRMDLVRATALRLRGEHDLALAVLGPVWARLRAAHPDGTGDWPTAAVELAWLWLLSGEVADARRLAARVLAVLDGRGLSRHHLATEASTVLVEAELALAWPQRRSRPEDWAAAVRRVAAELADRVDSHGQDDPHTLAVMVLHGQTLQNDARPAEALVVLTDAEKRVAEALGAEHPLALRARLWAAMATGTSGDWAAATERLRALLPRHEAILGRAHQETQLTRLQLGVGLAMTHRQREARPLIDEARQSLGGRHGPWRQWGAVAAAGVVMTRLPAPVWRLAGLVGGRRRE